MDKWQPIETAPKTMETVILYQKEVGVFFGYGRHDEDNKRAIFYRSNMPPSFKFDPTHWMPLPDPPAKEK